MELILEFPHWSRCHPGFVINGVDAKSNDFGRTEVTNPGLIADLFTSGYAEVEGPSDENLEAGGCGRHVFIVVPATPEVLTKYAITEAEYAEVAAKLTAGLTFGVCNACN